MGNVIRFPQEIRTVTFDDLPAGPAVVLILPVTYVDRTPGGRGRFSLANLPEYKPGDRSADLGAGLFPYV